MSHEVDYLIEAIAGVNSRWAIAAYAIAALFAVLKLLLPANQSQALRTSNDGKGKPVPCITVSFAWTVVILMLILGALPTVAYTYLEHGGTRLLSDYRVWALVLDPLGAPVSGASVQGQGGTVTKTTSNGIGEVMIPRVNVPADDMEAIWADVTSEFFSGRPYLWGRSEVGLRRDPIRSIVIHLDAQGSAAVSGVVRDNEHRAVADATVSILGGESGHTAPNGTFTLKTNVADGQQVRIHTEKSGYKSVDQSHRAGYPVIITIDQVSSAEAKDSRHWEPSKGELP